MSAELEARDVLFVGAGRAPAPVAVKRSPEAEPCAPAAGDPDRRRGFRAWIYDVHDVQGLLLTAARRYRIAAEGYERAADDEIRLIAWERGWDAAEAELDAAAGRSDELVGLDRWTFYYINRKHAQRLRMLSGLWQRWGDRVAGVQHRDRSSVKALYHEFDKAWQSAARRPRTGDDWVRLRHYDYPLQTALGLLVPQRVGYHMPAPLSFSVTTRARRLHARGDLWDRIVPCNRERKSRAVTDTDGRPVRPFRARRPPRRWVEQVLVDYDTIDRVHPAIASRAVHTARSQHSATSTLPATDGT